MYNRKPEALSLAKMQAALNLLLKPASVENSANAVLFRWFDRLLCPWPRTGRHL
jgi:hypothetical protein